MSRVIFVIFHREDNAVYDIYFTRDECLQAYSDLIAQDAVNRSRYYCKAVNMGFMSAEKHTFHVQKRA